MKNLIRAGALCLLLLPGALPVGTSLAQAPELPIKHAQGQTAVPQNPEKVFVFDLASLDTLHTIGVEVAGVPSGRKPDHLQEYESDDYLKIGSLFEPDLELISAEKPDLIIVGGRSAAKYSDLAQLAATIDMTTNRKDYIGSAVANADTLGRIFGKQAEVDQLVTRLENFTAELRSRAGQAGTALAIITTGGRMSAHGPGSRFGVLYDDFGFKPAAEGLDTGTHGQAISFEFLLETNPDWLIVIDRDAAIGQGGTAAQQMLDNDIMHRTTAWQKGQIVYANAANWYLIGGGLTSLQEIVDELLAALSTS